MNFSLIDERVKVLHETVRRRGVSFGFAESCTGGLLSSWVARRPGISDFFLGSVVSYSPKIKQLILKVAEQDMQTAGVVSELVALEMARGLCQQLKVQWAASITGTAGPTGGTDQAPVGTVCIGIYGPQFEKTSTYFFSGDRHEIQAQAAFEALNLLIKSVTF